MRTANKQFEGLDGEFELTVFNPIEVFRIGREVLRSLKINIANLSVTDNINTFLNHLCNLDEKDMLTIIDLFFAKLTFNSKLVTQDLFAGNLSQFFAVIKWIIDENHFFGNSDISQVIKQKVAEFLGTNEIV